MHHLPDIRSLMLFIHFCFFNHLSILICCSIESAIIRLEIDLSKKGNSSPVVALSTLTPWPPRDPVRPSGTWCDPVRRRQIRLSPCVIGVGTDLPIVPWSPPAPPNWPVVSNHIWRGTSSQIYFISRRWTWTTISPTPAR